MKKEKVLNDVLSQVPEDLTIVYERKTTTQLDIPYTLTAVGYSKFWFDKEALPDLTHEEKLILINANNRDPLFTPEKVLAAIFKAREIRRRSASPKDAIEKCNNVLLEENREYIGAITAAKEHANQRELKASQLECYLANEKEMAHYEKVQASRLSGLVNLKNRILQAITRKPFTEPPVSETELEEGRKAWAKFRKKLGASEKTSNEALLMRYKYNSNRISGLPFEYMSHTPEIQALAEEYSISTIALQILDGSALKKAENAISKNSSQYLKTLESYGQTL